MHTEEDEIYVVVAKNDVPHSRWGPDEGGELVFETYTKMATLEEAKRRAKQLTKTYGKCRIARLEFISE